MGWTQEFHIKTLLTEPLSQNFTKTKNAFRDWSSPSTYPIFWQPYRWHQEGVYPSYIGGRNLAKVRTICKYWRWYDNILRLWFTNFYPPPFPVVLLETWPLLYPMLLFWDLCKIVHPLKIFSNSTIRDPRHTFFVVFWK